MKRFLTALFALFTLFTGFLPLPAATVELTAIPEKPVAGDVFNFRLKVDSGGKFSVSIPQMPAGIEVSRHTSGQSSSTTIINGKRTEETVLSFSAIAEKPGTYKIPPFELKSDSGKILSNELTITVQDAASLPPQDRFFATMTIFPEREVYVGETLRASINIFIPDRWHLNGITNLKMNNFPTASFIKQGDPPQDFTIKLSTRSQSYIVNCTGYFQVLQSGSFEPECIMDLVLDEAGGFFGQSTGKRLVAESTGTLKVNPLPPAPSGTINTGLTGSWQILASLSKTEIRAGEIAELDLTVKGSYPAPGFKAPVLEIAGARNYPPELIKNENATDFIIKYPFVPMTPGKYDLSISLQTFDPEKKSYVPHEISLHYTVTPNPELAGVKTENPVSEADEKNPHSPAQLIPFPLEKSTSKVALPLFNNVRLPVILLVICGVAAIAAAIGMSRRDPEAKKRKKAWEKLIFRIAAGEDPSVCVSENLPLIASAAGLPENASWEDIASLLSDNDKILKEFFLSVDSANFAPQTNSESVSPQVKEKLLKFFKHLAIVFILFAAPSVWGQSDSGKTEFDSGNYQLAAEKFQHDLLNYPVSADPAQLYNIGSAEYMAGNYPASWIFFTRASLLAPGNRQYASACEKSAEKLPAVPPALPVYWRWASFMRPDQFLLTAAIAWALTGLVILFRKKISRQLLTVILTGLTVVMILSLAASFNPAYSGDRAMVIGKEAPLRSIPAAAGGTEVLLPGGTSLVIREQNGDFYRISGENISGWIRTGDVMRIFPYDKY